ncbi:DUF3331 domain-containing protein [Paraburkholderia franconis]|nr:DUF3331 domain-containing protein [Paraburkholderia franconis]
MKKLRRRKRAAIRSFEPLIAEARPAHVSIVAQLSSQTLSVYWSDPQSGHYADQVWRLGIAHRPSNCVLTGMPIHLGDTVFRPHASETRVPVNRHRMILAAAVRPLDEVS